MKLNTKDSFENVSSAREIASAIALNSFKQCEILLKDLSDIFKPAHTTLQNKCFHQVAFIIIWWHLYSIIHTFTINII